MGAKFCFFTDPALLGQQVVDEAFGPLAPLGTVHRFHLGDLHSGPAGAPVVAICDGQICAQRCPGGELTLILKPADPPPFDFPFISYFIYRGVDPASLLNGDKIVVDATNDLATKVRASWVIPENENDDPDADKRALGLHLTATGPMSDTTKYADGKPLDRLFYQGDPAFDPVYVTAGETLGKFGPLFGLGIVVERIGHPAEIGWTRCVRHEISFEDLSGGEAPTSVTAFEHWHKKDAVLDFVDPCAFWGAFRQGGLKASKTVAKVKADDIYDTVLRGAHNDAPDGAFVNRNRAYLDIRDEHGHSLNYYKAPSVGDNFQIQLGDGGKTTDNALVEVNYYGSGWPSYWIDSALLQAMVDPPQDAVAVRFALPKTSYSKPLAYVSVGYVLPKRGNKDLRPPTDQERFIDRPKKAASSYTEPGVIGVPIVTVGGQSRFAASYQKISHFKRYDAETAARAPDPNAPATVAPAPKALLDHVLPLPGDHVFPNVSGVASVKTFADLVYVSSPSAASVGFVARPGFAQEGGNVYLFLFPAARHLFAGAVEYTAEAGQPVLQELTHFLPDYLKPRSPAGFRFTTLTLPGPTVVAAIHENVRGSVRQPSDLGFDFIVLAMTSNAYDAALAPAAQTVTLAGTGVLSLARSAPLIDAVGLPYRDATLTYSCISRPSTASPSAVVNRAGPTPLPKLYAHAIL